MRLSTSTNIMVFDKGVNYAVRMEDSMKACAEAGYEYLDANLCSQARPGQPLAADDWEGWAHRMRALAEGLGVRLTQAHAYWPIKYTVFPDGSRSDGDLGEELMRRSVIAARILGAEWMVVHPLTVADEVWYSARRSFDYNRAYYGRWADLYAEHGVGMAIENMNCVNGKMRYGAAPDDLVELVEAVGHPLVGICLDTGHAHMSGLDVAAAVRRLVPHLRATHIADNHGNADEHFAPFNGTVDWAATMKALGEVGYQNDFSFEIHMLTAPYPAAVQKNLIRFTHDLGGYLLSLARGG